MRRTHQWHKVLYHLVIWACGNKAFTIIQCEVPFETRNAGHECQMESSYSEKRPGVTPDMNSADKVEMFNAFLASVFNSNDKPWDYQDPELEACDCRNNKLLAN